MKRIISLFLLLSVAFTALAGLPVQAQGAPIVSTETDTIVPFPEDAGEEAAAPSPEAGTYDARASVAPRSASTSSQDILDFIKEREGFHAKPYWDYAQWTIGYGTFCGRTREEVPEEYWDGITRELAEELLRTEIANNYEKAVAQYAEANNLTFTQNEFDALVSFTFNLGSGWTRGGYRINQWLENRTTDLEMVWSMGVWCRAGGTVLTGLCTRRIGESQIFLYGDYSSGDSGHPGYRYVRYTGGGSYLAGQYTDDVGYYVLGNAYGQLPTPVWRAAGRSSTAAAATDSVAAYNATSSLPFTDVPAGKWYYQAVAEVYQTGLMQGVSATKFAPNDTLTRAQAVTVLYRLADSPAVSGSSSFTDVPSGRFYTDAVSWAASNGIVNGVTLTEFRPNELITREQLAAIFYRYYEVYGSGSAIQAADLNQFPDGSQVSNYAKEALSWAVGVGLIQGVSEGGKSYLRASQTSTRAQLAIILTRFIQLDSSRTFLGWFTDDGIQVTSGTTVRQNETLEARWSTAE